VTVEDGANLVCTGNNTINDPEQSDYVASFGGTIKGVAAEKITLHGDM